MTIACTDCGTLQDIPPLPWGAIAICPTCDNRLERTNGRSINGALACASVTPLLLFPANLLPIMHVSMLGMTRASRLGSGVVTLWQHQWVLVALLVAAFAVILPFVRFGLSPAAPSGNLQHALDELASAARAVRSLADYLDQHPEALVRGRRPAPE